MKLTIRSFSFGASLGLLVGCWKTDPNHCGSNLGDESCASGMFCDWCEPDNNGCVAQRPSPGCYLEDSPEETEGSSAGEISTGMTQASTTPGDTPDGGGSTISDGSSTAGSARCTANDDCMDPVAPICDTTSGECITCAATVDPNAACAGLDPGAPLCANGACVQCTAGSTSVCDEQLLSCDVGSNTCIPCAAHQQCSSEACELSAGTCFPPGDVLHVDGDGGQDFPNVVMAVASVGAGEHQVIVVHELDGALSYQGSVLVNAGKTIALLEATGEHPTILGTGIDPGIRVTGAGTNLYVDGLELSNAAATGVIVDGAYAWFDRTRIIGNDGGGILAQNAANLILRSCFVGGNVDVNVLEIQSSSAEILYSTLGAGLGVTTSITCDAVANVGLRNSIVVSRSTNAEIACAAIDATHTATEMMLPGTGNTALGDMDTLWFHGFNAGDFHLTNAPFRIANTAQWELGDPATDIDGDDRPTTDGAPDVPGADLP